MAKVVTLKRTIEVELNGETISIPVDCKGYWENDGIGSYECHGYKGFDSGRTYFLIETWSWEAEGYHLTKRQISRVERLLEKQVKVWEEEYAQECADKEAREYNEPKQNEEQI